MYKVNRTGESTVPCGAPVLHNTVSDTQSFSLTVCTWPLSHIHTSYFTYNTESCHSQKFSDDSAVVGCIRDGQEGEYRSLVDNFVQWCRHNHLQLNATKTKEMVVVVVVVVVGKGPGLLD